jgi:hypothetical protein
MILERFAQGNVAEPLIVAELFRRGYDMAWTGDEQQTVEMDCGPVVIRCHPDGVIRFTSETDRVMEIKALRPTFPRDFRPYLWQASIEMAATGLPLLWVYGRKDADGNVDLADLEMVAVDKPYFTPVEIKRRALAVYRAVEKGLVPPCDFRQFPCGFWTDPDAACSQGATKDEVEDLGLPARVVDEYLAAKGVAEYAAKEFKRVQDHIKSMLADRPGTRYKAGKLQMVKVTGTRKLDKKAVKEAGVDLDPYMTPGADYWRIDVGE